ncbi:TRAP transporter small permease subunit [Acuticoccus sp. M5D2P5]|uniref:TRAP transporter small permease n=1 Tax=Acuticoccus kalidii TaxID=2910977 RepID=UPI001F35BFD7|nr:TRAP transporter small permease subunit [Acuticoccus kalidii]MCF3936216.1 TRAP transporter small permease subunit [Acuticoccus kalidii]
MPFAERRAFISAKLNELVTTVCVLFVLAMLSISFAGFFYMIITGNALSWTYSLARLFIPWLGLLSITVAFVYGEHIAMTSLLGIMPRPVVRVIMAINYGLVALFALMMIWYGTNFFLSSSDVYMVSDQIQIHARWVVAAVPLTGLVLLIHVLCGADLLSAEDPMEEAEHLAAGDKEPLA